MTAVRWADLAAKVALVGLLVLAFAYPDLSGMKERGASARLAVYPLGAVAVPLWWFLRHRRAGRPYPWVADLLVTSPWTVDLLGNRLNLFDTVGWWDDLMHFVNWLLLTAGVLVAWRPGPRTSRGLIMMVALGFGTTAALVWELGEYVWFIRASPNPNIVYRDTLGDLTLGTLGTVVAGTLVAGLGSRRKPEGHEEGLGYH